LSRGRRGLRGGHRRVGCVGNRASGCHFVVVAVVGLDGMLGLWGRNQAACGPVCVVARRWKGRVLLVVMTVEMDDGAEVRRERFGGVVNTLWDDVWR